MLKSLSESLRSLWHPKTEEAVQTAGRKRKRSAKERDQDDADVEIVSVKRPRQSDPDSGLLSYLRVPMSKMSEWVRKKTVRQDHFFVRPIPADSHWSQNRQREDRESQRARCLDQTLDARNGLLTYGHVAQDGDRLSRPSIHRNGTYENGVNGDGGLEGENTGVCSISVPSSPHSSCSSARPSTGRHSTVDKCFHLKERDEYLKLLQQYTTVDLGYRSSRNQVDNLSSVAGRDVHRKPSLYNPMPSPSSSVSSQSSIASSFHQPSPRFRVTPSRYTSSQSVFRSSERPASSSSTSSSTTERFTIPRQPSRALQVMSTFWRRDREQGSFSLQMGKLGASQQHKAESSVLDGQQRSDADQRLKGKPVYDGDQRLKVTLVSSADQGSKITVASEVDETERLKAMPECEGNQRVKVMPISDAGERLKSTDSEADQRLVEEGKTKTPALNFLSSEYLDNDWLSKLNKKYSSSEMERQQLIREAEIKKKLLEERRETRLANLDKKLKQQMRLFDEEPEVIEELPLPEVPQEKALPELTDAMQKEITAALDGGPASQVLAEGFRLQLTRADIATLRGLNWLNDEVINYYMNMLMERGEQDGFSKTYAFNTFFYPKLLSGGHAAVKRWTRKVDIFSHDYLVIPVHLGVHWCLCVVFMKDKKICYYDSMGGNNNQCLNAVRQYLSEESAQKRNVTLDMSDWSAEIVKDIPQQMNGSDCGMFTCMYAETLTRGESITFTQKDMPYFRRRMVYEILKKKLL